MAHHQKQKRKFPAQGIGRGSGAGGLQGHASLPPKPGIPGKPLPRDTGPIVLTGGKDNAVSGCFSYSHVAKRTYSSTATKAESPTATRREPVMTALAPAVQLKAITSPVHHQSQPIATAITPPAEVMTRPFSNQVASLMNHGSEFNDAGTRSENQISFQQDGVDPEGVRNDLTGNNSRTEFVYPSDFRPEMISQHPSFLSFPHPTFYDNNNETGFHPNRNFAHLNDHEASSMPNGLISDGYPPYLLPPPLPPPHVHPHPHYTHRQYQNQSQHHQNFIQHGSQDPYSFPNSMTPPNTGTLFAPPPPFQPHGALNGSNQTSEMGGSTNPQTPFTPTHSFPMNLDLQHPHPQHSVFPPPSDRMVHFENLHQEQRQNKNQAFESTLEASLNGRPKHSGVIEDNPLLNSISFFPPGSDQLRNEASNENTIPTSLLDNSSGEMGHHEYIPDRNEKTHLGEFGLSIDTSRESAGKVAAHRLQTYCLGYYLSDRLADVNLFVKQIGEGFEWGSENFNAHSFILGRSIKLANLIGDTIKEKEESASTNIEASETIGEPSRNSSQISWASEVENGRRDNERLLPVPRIVPARKVTVLLENNDKYLSRYSFLLALRWLYGGEDWELDAYLDPSHPKHRTLEWTREDSVGVEGFEKGPADELATTLRYNKNQRATGESIGPISPENDTGETESEEVRMLERSFALLAAGTLLGVDEVIDKGTWGIRKWGMRFEGGAFERLLEFALEGSEEVDSYGVLNSGVHGPNAKYGVFTKHLLDEAVAFLVKNLPNQFRFDSRAPASKYLVRFPEVPYQSSICLSTPIAPVDRDLNRPESLRRAYSTVLLSVPFSLLRAILEHDGFATKNGDWKGIARYDIAKAVVHERERRRKYGFKVARERRVSICSETIEVRVADEYNSDTNLTLVPPSNKEGLESENLYWEESVLCTFGHGGNGLEITRRRKGGSNGGRVLWKVGDTPMKI